LKYLNNILERFIILIKNPTIINIISVGVIALAVKGFGFLKEVVVAETFGLSELLDTFFIAALVPGFVNDVFLNAFKNVFIPNYIAEKKTSKNHGSLQSTAFIVTIFTSIFFIIIAFIFTDVYLESFFGGKSDAYYNLVKVQFYYLLPCIIFWGLSSLLSGLLNIYNEFRYSSMYPVLTSVTMLIALLFFREALGEKVLAVGMFLGSIFQFVFLLVIAFKKKIIKIRKPNFKNHNTQVMFKQIPAKVSSGFLTGMIPLTDQIFAGQLIVGSIAALNYGLKIPAFFSSIIILATGSVLLPYFANLSIDNRDKAFKKLYFILKRLFIALIIISVVLMIFSNTIIELTFERNKFTSDDTDLVANIQRMFLIGIPFTICGNIVVRFLTSINKNSFMAYVSFGSMILNIILDFVLIKYYGIMGIALCTAILQIVRSIILFLYTVNQNKVLN